MSSPTINTQRLLLRPWKEADAEEYFRINQDPKVIEYLGGPMTMEEVTQFITDMNQRLQEHRYTLWAVEEKATGAMMGFTGLQAPKWPSTPRTAHFMPCIEIGWRLGSEYWGHGYATEGAKAVLQYGFETLRLEEIVSFTVPANQRSIRVMEKIGMERDVNGGFAHPMLAADHPLSWHLLHRIRRGH